MIRVDVYPDTEALSRAVARAVVESAADAVSRSGRFLWCLAGGDTPRHAYELLAGNRLAAQVPWDHTHVFFGDERCVAADASESNYGMAREALLSRVPIPTDQVHRIAGDREPDEAARAYEGTLVSVLGGSTHGHPAHDFDLVLLGMGTDGHTASLFPGSRDESDRWVSARRHPVDGRWRVTVLPRVLNAARSVLFVVAGSRKAGMVAEALQGPNRPEELPVHRIRPRGSLGWILDREAASALAPVENRWWEQGSRKMAVEVHA